MQIGNYDFQGGGACPEQYDVWDKDGNLVGYVRLRWGDLTAEYPKVGGTCIYSTRIGDGWTGCFESDDQRVTHLRKIAKRLDLFKHHVYCPECNEQYNLDEYDLDELDKDGEKWIQCPECLDLFKVETVEKIVSEHPDLGYSIVDRSSLVVKRRREE